MEIKEIFKEFMTLSWGGNNVRNIELTDIRLSDYSILRIQTNGCTIYNLITGTKLYISWKWVNLFSELNTYAGSRLLRKDIKAEDNIEKLILEFLALIAAIESRKPDSILNLMGNLKSTKEFREWLEEEYEETLNPIEVWMLDDYRTI